MSVLPACLHACMYVLHVLCLVLAEVKRRYGVPLVL